VSAATNERGVFLASLPLKAFYCGSEVSYLVAELAELAGVSPHDVLDKTASVAERWETDGQDWDTLADVLAWLREPAHGRHADEIEIVLRREGHQERMVAALGIKEARS
jgi:predicted transcriptional regulator